MFVSFLDYKNSFNSTQVQLTFPPKNGAKACFKKTQMDKKSLFVAIEGLDGSGKTSVTRYLSNILNKESPGKVKLTFEPHDPSCAGLFIRQVLTKKITDFSPKILALAFAANRLDHCAREIKPWLNSKEGAIVLCDRYYVSSLVYQSTDDLNFEEVYTLNDAAIKPDIIFFLNVSNAVCYERMERRNEARELFETNLSQTRKKFHQAIDFLRKNKNETIIEIDASGSLQEVSNLILSELYTIDPLLKPKRPEASDSLDAELKFVPLDGGIVYTLKEAINDLNVPALLKNGESRENTLTKIESEVDRFDFYQLGSLFLDHIKKNNYEIKGKLPWIDLDAFELGYQLPGGIALSGVALILKENQKYDSILKTAPDVPKMSDFMFVFSPGPSASVIDYYERGMLQYNVDGLREGLFPSVKFITQKNLAGAILLFAEELVGK